MEKNMWYQKPEMVVALSALLISFVTAFVGIYSAYIDRAYTRASVWPRLEVFSSFGGETFDYGVTNNGTGPALIKYAKITYDSNIIQFWNDIPEIPNFIQSHIGSRILPSQATINPIKHRGEGSRKFFELNESVKMELCYCSIYDECWVVDKANQPTEIESCTISENDKFLQ